MPTSRFHRHVLTTLLGLLSLPIFALSQEGWAQQRTAGVVSAVASAVPTPPGDSLALREALVSLEALRDRGGWGEVPATGELLRPGESGARVRMLRERLILSGDFPVQVRAAPTSFGPSDEFDDDLEAAVRRFQARHALDVDGVVGPATLSALNVPVESRIRQVQVNLERRREFRPDPGPVSIVVNLPGFQAMVVEEGHETALHRVIVGRRDRPTPILSGQIEHVVLAPYWNVPPGILRNDKLPEIRSDSTYLSRQGISVIDRATERAVDPGSVAWQSITATEFNARYWLRQNPGPGNALGRVKFIFPNSHHVFLHDTPDRHLFERGTRAFSSGCLRLDDPMALAQRLLAPVPGWESARIQEVAVGGVERWVALPDPVPIQTVYWTAWVGGDGTLHLADDLYGLDAGRTLALLEEGMSECAQL